MFSISTSTWTSCSFISLFLRVCFKQIDHKGGQPTCLCRSQRRQVLQVDVVVVLLLPLEPDRLEETAEGPVPLCELLELLLSGLPRHPYFSSPYLIAGFSSSLSSSSSASYFEILRSR